MPNWCECELFITGDKLERNRLEEATRVKEGEKKETESTHLLLENLCPMPEEIRMSVSPMHVVATQEEADAENAQPSSWPGEEGKLRAITEKEALRRKEKYGATNWYDWCCLHWGTKWGDCRTELITHDEKMTSFAFDTAWSPPIAGLQEISKIFPKLTFRIKFWEGGMGFRGGATIKNGKITSEWQGSYRGNRGG